MCMRRQNKNIPYMERSMSEHSCIPIIYLTLNNQLIFVCMYVFRYVCLCVCMCLCVSARVQQNDNMYVYTYTSRCVLWTRAARQPPLRLVSNNRLHRNN